MSADKNQVTGKVYQLKVSLRGISPMIWRRRLVTSDTSIDHLHAILQIAMGWEDVHLHCFRIHGKDYGTSRAGGLLFVDDPYQVRLSDFELRTGERFVYEYDMGSCWHHEIRLERVLPLGPETRIPSARAERATVHRKTVAVHGATRPLWRSIIPCWSCCKRARM